jgi:hypothetical protein
MNMKGVGLYFFLISIWKKPLNESKKAPMIANEIARGEDSITVLPVEEG